MTATKKRGTFGALAIRVSGLLAMAAALAPLACAKGTYLEVQFTGTGLPEIHAIAVDLALTPPDAAVVRSSDLVTKDDAKSVITLPASMALRLDGDEGALTVAATALNAQNQEVARASKSTTIMHGQTWKLVVNLIPPITSTLTASSDTSAQGSVDAGGN